MMEPDTARRKQLGRTTQPDRRPHCPLHPYSAGGDQPQIRQGENHQHDHSPAPNKSGPALKADRRPRREQQPPRPRSGPPTHQQPDSVPRCTRPCDGESPPADTARHSSSHPQTARKSRSLNRPAHTAGHQKQRHSVRHTARHFFASKAQIRHIPAVLHPL